MIEFYAFEIQKLLENIIKDKCGWKIYHQVVTGCHSSLNINYNSGRYGCWRTCQVEQHEEGHKIL